MNILIEGDSWAYTFLFPKPGVSEQHAGFSRWLAEQHFVITNAMPGSSNALSIERIRAYSKPVDLIIWIQTEPVRDFFTDQHVHMAVTNSPRPVLDYQQIYNSADQLGSLKAAFRHHLRSVTYPALDQAAKEKNAQVLMLGGCSPVQEHLLGGLDNLHSIIPNIPGLLLPNCPYQDCLFQNTHCWADHEYADYVVNSGNVKLIQDWFAETKRINEKLLAWQNDTVYFNPDKWHINTAGHRILANALIDYINKLNK